MVMLERVRQDASKQTGEQRDELDKQKKLTFHKNVFNRSYYENLTFSWQQKLFTEPSVRGQELSQASVYLCPKDYSEVIVERNVVSLCGYPLCSQPPKIYKSDTVLSVRDRKLYDITPIKPFCSKLSSEPVYLRDFKKFILVEVVPLGIPVAEYVQKRKSLVDLIQEEKKLIQKKYIDKRIKSATEEVASSLVPLLKDVKLEEQAQVKVQPQTEPTLNHTAIEGYDAPLVPSSIKAKEENSIPPPAKSGVKIDVEESDIDSSDDSEFYEDDDSQAESVETPKPKSSPELTIFGKLFLLLDHSSTTSSREFFEHIRRSQDPAAPRKRFINKFIPRDDNVVLRQDMLSKLLLERLKFAMKVLGISTSFDRELMDWIVTLDVYEPEMGWLTPAEALCLVLVFLTRLSQCLSTADLGSVSGEKMATLASSVGFDLDRIRNLTRKL